MFSNFLNLLFLVGTLNVLGIMAAPAEFHQVTALPEDIPTCNEDANLNDCIRSSMQTMLKRSKNGVPELNIPAIDPMMVDKSTVQFENNFVQGKVAVRNVQIQGVSDSIVKKVEFKRDGDKITMSTQSFTPKLLINGQYKAEVFVNNNKMSSKGVFNITMDKIDAKTEITGETYEKDGHTYLRMTAFNIDPTLGDMKMYATGLVADPNLNDALLDFANQNWRQIYKSIIPETRSTWEPMFLKHSNEFFSHLPLDLILKHNS